MSSVATMEEIKARIEGLLKAQEETGKQIRESQIKTDEQLRQTDKQLRQTDEQLRQTDEQLRQTDKKLNKLEELFTGQWGKLIESLVEGDLVNLLNKRGIKVDQTTERVNSRKSGGLDYEFDILAVNGEEVVVVEVKTTLKPKDVDYFIKKLGVFKQICTGYKSNTIYGAVAYLKDASGAARYSERQGLFVIRATGDSASIINKEDFKPKTF